MFRVYGDSFFKLAEVLMIIKEIRASDDALITPERHDLGALIRELTEFRDACERSRMKLSALQLGRILKHVQAGTMTVGILRQMTDELQGRVYDELASILLFQVPPDKVRLLQLPLWIGDDVIAKFPEAGHDAEEAGKCLAYGRGTATVFHPDANYGGRTRLSRR
jgi:hypothetical protein